ncbi:MAG TPA: hypothetical protein VFK14_11330 [Solirubrobacterales bacterium]|nr:hypothetical protein [Solirubrobacterales bacterium]
MPSLLALAFFCSLAPSAAATEPLRITEVEVAGGKEAWNPDGVFRIGWTQVPGPPVLPRAVVYRLYNSSGQMVKGPMRETDTVASIPALAVPLIPDVYKLEMWLEDAEGQAGPAAFANLRFDDAAPAKPAVAAPAGWLTSHKETRLQIEPPSGPAPLAGIRGYAISLDAGTGGSPCALATLCTLAETDLLGSGGGPFSLGFLPEGTAFARIVAVSNAGVPSPPVAVALQVDGTAPDVSLQGLPGGWSDGPVRLTATAGDPLSGMTANGTSGPFTAIAVDGGAPAEALGGSVSTWVSGSGIHQVSYFARDAAGNIGDGSLATATALVAVDEAPPRVAFAAAQDPAEPERIEATVADALSGPSPDRGTIAVRSAGSRSEYRRLPTRVAGDRLVADWESDSYPPGKYEFRATGYDRAGNAASGSDRARGAKMVLVNPLKEPASLEAGFGGRELVYQRCSRSRRGRRCHRRRLTRFDLRPARRTVPFGHGVRFGGRLSGARKGRQGGLEVTVTETFAAGADPHQRTTTVRTAADGSFSLQLPPGPSRDVTAAFPGTRTLTRAAARTVHLEVLGAVRLHASAATAQVGGAPVVFSGSVDPTGVAAAKDGLPVELQFRYPGARWSEFRTVETDARGRFRYAYRFSDDDSRNVRFQFRAYAKGREGWPYEPAFSRPVAVLGR